MVRGRLTRGSRRAITQASEAVQDNDSAVPTIAPILFAYPFAQRFFVKGLTLGASKG
jgi:ABC-type glycerol-3-phosphate transport system permease component